MHETCNQAVIRISYACSERMVWRSLELQRARRPSLARHRARLGPARARPVLDPTAAGAARAAAHCGPAARPAPRRDRSHRDRPLPERVRVLSMGIEEERPRVGDFYEQVVLPALMQRLDQAFPEFGWRADSRGWVATNQQHTHERLGVRADRVVAHEPHGFLIHGGDSMLWTAYVNGGSIPRGADFVRAVTDLAVRAGVDTAPLDRPRPRRAKLRESFFELARQELADPHGARARTYLERRGFPVEAISTSGLGLVPPAETTGRVLEDRGYRVEE